MPACSCSVAGIDRHEAGEPHQALHPFAVDDMALGRQPRRHPPRAIILTRQVQPIEQRHSLGPPALAGLGDQRVDLLDPLHGVAGQRRGEREQLGVGRIGGGADICLARPPEKDELNAYVRTLERRIVQSGQDQAQLLWTYLHNEWKLISPSGANIILSHLESSFVHMIARNAGRAVRRRDIIAQAFGQDPLHYDNRRLEALVSRLRKKVHRSYPLSQPIKVVHSIGYVFTDAIKCIEFPCGK